MSIILNFGMSDGFQKVDFANLKWPAEMVRLFAVTFLLPPLADFSCLPLPSFASSSIMSGSIRLRARRTGAAIPTTTQRPTTSTRASLASPSLAPAVVDAVH